VCAREGLKQAILQDAIYAARDIVWEGASKMKIRAAGTCDSNQKASEPYNIHGYVVYIAGIFHGVAACGHLCKLLMIHDLEELPCCTCRRELFDCNVCRMRKSQEVKI